MKKLKQIQLYFYVGNHTIEYSIIHFHGELTREKWHKLYKTVKGKIKQGVE